MDNNRLPESIVVKLFDQVKTSSDQNTEAVKDLTRVVNDLTKCIEKQPDLNDMAGMCINRGHDVEEIKNYTKESCENSRRVLYRVAIMMVSVGIAFALMVTSYFFVRNSVENMIDNHIEEIYNNMDQEDG